MAEQKKYNKSKNYSNQNRNKNQRYQGNKRNYNKNNYRNNHNNNQARPNPSASPKEIPKQQTQSKAESSNDLLWFTIFLVSLAGYFLAQKFYFPPKEKTSIYGLTANLPFVKEGKLAFIDTQSDGHIADIDIEVAKTDYEITQGLMHRKYLPANGGMLFVFNEEAPRTFWMKDTYLALDILFINANKEIIRIRKNAAPFSELSIPSGGKAQYVVEVLAGFTESYQIHVGDRIEFQY